MLNYIAITKAIAMSHQTKAGWYWTHIELRRLINDWNLIPGCPNDEFNLLRSKLLKVLQQPHDVDDIVRLLASELIVTYGLSPKMADVETLAAEVEAWWSNRP